MSTAREAARDAARAAYTLDLYRHAVLVPWQLELLRCLFEKVGQSPAGELDSR